RPTSRAPATRHRAWSPGRRRTGTAAIELPSPAAGTSSTAAREDVRPASRTITGTGTPEVEPKSPKRKGPRRACASAGASVPSHRRVCSDLVLSTRETDDDLRDLVEFVRDSLFDARVLDFCGRVPDSVPSSMSLQLFEGCL